MRLQFASLTKRNTSSMTTEGVPERASTLVQTLDLTTSPQEEGVSSSFPDSVEPQGALPRTARAFCLPAQPRTILTSEQRSMAADELCHPLPEAHVRGDSLNKPPAAGFMHHTAILDEYEVSFGIQNPKMDDTTASTVPSSYIKRGAIVLSLLKDQTIFQRYLDNWSSLGGGLVSIEPMVRIFTTGIWTTWGKTLKEQNPKEVQQMSEEIWQNTLRPVSRLLNRHTSPTEFCGAVTNKNLRWEVVGIALTLVAILCQTLSATDPIFCSHTAPTENREDLILRAQNASEMCISFCEDFAIMNDLYLWFLYENTGLYCSLRSKGSPQSWKRRGILETALMFSNLHQEIKVDDITPFFISELRKRLFIYTYANDKSSAVYYGRPPRLTRNYCLLQFPLDLTDGQLMLEGPELDVALQSLDKEGWNLKEKIYRNTSTRVCITNSLLTEEILEISFGTLPQNEITTRVGDIERRAIQHQESLPKFLRIENQPFKELKRQPIELLYMAYIRLDNLNLHFLLQRTLVKKLGADNSRLLTIAQEIFSFIILLIHNLHHFLDFKFDIIQLLTMNGIPSASIIALELLHQEQNPTSASALANSIPRSSTIQDLSVFVACLGNAKSFNNSNNSCSRGSRFLTKILDTILAPKAIRCAGDDSDIQHMVQPSPSAFFQLGAYDCDFMKWLDVMDFECESWANVLETNG